MYICIYTHYIIRSTQKSESLGIKAMFPLRCSCAVVGHGAGSPWSASDGQAPRSHQRFNVSEDDPRDVGISWGFYSDFMMIYGDFMGFYGDLLVILWDIPSGFIKHGWEIPWMKVSS